MSGSKRLSLIGCGRLGLCFGLCAEQCGYSVLACEPPQRQDYVDQLNSRQFDSYEPKVNEYLRKSSKECFRATTQLPEALEYASLIFIFVDTPSTEKEIYDHGNVERVLEQINIARVKDKHIVVGCTVMPGFLDKAKQLLADCVNVSLSYNPEFIAQGNIVYGLEYPDMVLIGEGSPEAGGIIEQVYKDMCKESPPIRRMSVRSAEICKLSLNCFITTKISFANMIGDIADRTNQLHPSAMANKDDILTAVGCDSRVGSKCIRAGYGFGGPCFPRDNRALAQYADAVGVDAMVSKATETYNKYHAGVQADMMLASGAAEFVFSDVAYKDNCPVPIVEESQKIIVALRLLECAARDGRSVTVRLRDRRMILDAVKREFDPEGKKFVYEYTD